MFVIAITGLWWRGRIQECADTSEHLVNNFEVWVVEDDVTSPAIYKQWTFYGDEDGFHFTWSGWPFDWVKGSTDTQTGLTFSNPKVYLLFGFRDEWSYDYNQDIFLEIWQMQLYYQLP